MKGPMMTFPPPDPDRPRNGDQLWEKMSPASQERIMRIFKDFAWQWATATAMAMDKDGRAQVLIPRELGRAISDGALEVFVGAPKAEALRAIIKDAETNR